MTIFGEESVKPDRSFDFLQNAGCQVLPGKEMLKIIGIILLIFIILFVLSLIIYFFNLDMKAASLLVPFMTKLYDRRKKKAKER